MMVLSHLGLFDLTHAACVSSKFYRIATPYIWSDLPELDDNPHVHSLLSSEIHLSQGALVSSFPLGYAPMLINC